MQAEWYCVDNDETVGPITLEALANHIRRTHGRSHMVWAKGMSDWTDARAVPSLSILLQSVSPQPSPATHLPAESAKPSATKQASLSQRVRHELIEYLLISSYLYVCFGSLIFYKMAVLRGEEIEFASYGLALVS
jgi:hypothetical protein